MYTLSPKVAYRKYGENVYVRNVETRKDFSFNEIVADILDIVSKEVSEKELLDTLREMYQVGEVPSFESDIRSFLALLVENQIIVKTEAGNETKTASPPGGIKEQFDKYCETVHQLSGICFELTYRCNEKCVHCYVDDPSETGKEMTLEQYKKVIDELCEMGCLNVLVTGGEPTLHPDFLPICEYITQKKMLLDIYTNGLHWTEELIDRICNLSVNSVSVSLYGGDAETHDAMTRVKGSFEKTLRTMLIFKSRGVDTYAKASITKQNFPGFEKLLKFGKQIGIPITPSFVLVPTHSGQIKNPLMLDNDAYREALAILEKFADGDVVSSNALKFGLRDMNDSVCSAGRTGLTINPYGEITPCNTLPLSLGNIYKNSLCHVWENSPELKRLSAFQFGDLDPKCANCKYSGACVVCLGAAYSENQGQFKPCVYTCGMAQARYELSETLLELGGQ